jgi:SAM-dependent methyltransferase
MSGLRSAARAIVRRLGVRRQATSYLAAVADRYYRARLAGDPRLDERVRQLQQMSRLEGHFAHMQLASGEAVHLALFLGQATLNLEARLAADGFDPAKSLILDAGDPDSLVLRSLGAKRGVSLNILDQCVRQVRSMGGRPVQGDCEALPFHDGAFDYGVCFETLEHLENPIHALKELRRVCKRRVFVSIPWVAKTRIHEDRHTDSDPDVEHHIFEFSPEDFPKVVSHSGCEIAYAGHLAIFPAIRNPVHRLLLSQFYYPSYFPAFQFYELTVVNGGA